MHQSQLSLRLDWSELDLFGHINNVMIFKYIQSARVHFWDEVGINSIDVSNPIGVVVANVQCQFLKNLFFPDTIKIISKCIEVKNSSFILEHQIFNSKEEKSAIGQDVIVMFDYSKREKMLIPDLIKNNLLNNEYHI